MFFFFFSRLTNILVPIATSYPTCNGSFETLLSQTYLLFVAVFNSKLSNIFLTHCTSIHALSNAFCASRPLCAHKCSERDPYVPNPVSSVLRRNRPKGKFSSSCRATSTFVIVVWNVVPPLSMQMFGRDKLGRHSSVGPQNHPRSFRLSCFLPASTRKFR